MQVKETNGDTRQFAVYCEKLKVIECENFYDCIIAYIGTFWLFDAKFPTNLSQSLTLLSFLLRITFKIPVFVQRLVNKLI